MACRKRLSNCPVSHVAMPVDTKLGGPPYQGGGGCVLYSAELQDGDSSRPRSFPRSDVRDIDLYTYPTLLSSVPFAFAVCPLIPLPVHPPRSAQLRRAPLKASTTSLIEDRYQTHQRGHPTKPSLDCATRQSPCRPDSQRPFPNSPVP